MTQVERSSQLSASPQEVWEVLSDFEAISAWAPNVDHSCLLSEQRFGVGAVRRIQSGRLTVVEKVKTWETDSELSYSIAGLPPIIRSVTNKWRLEPSTTGTKATLTTEIDAGRLPPQKLIAKVAGRKLGQASDQMLAGLAEYLRRDSSQ